MSSIWVKIPRKIRWALRSGSIGFARELAKELKHYFDNQYSQFNEEELLSALLHESSGFYIDVGAGRPVTGSNTFFLYKRGWTGICVDPIKNNHVLHRLLRPKDKFLRATCGKEAKLNFYLFNPYEYSTTVDEVAKEVQRKYGDEVRLVAKYEVSSLPLARVMKNHQGIRVDFLNVDTEGADLDILKSIDWNLLSPRVIAVEAWDESANTIKHFLSLKGYKFLGSRGPTLIFKT